MAAIKGIWQSSKQVFTLFKTITEQVAWNKSSLLLKIQKQNTQT